MWSARTLLCVCASTRAYVLCACVRACVRAHMHACVHAHMRVCDGCLRASVVRHLELGLLSRGGSGGKGVVVQGTHETEGTNRMDLGGCRCGASAFITYI